MYWPDLQLPPINLWNVPRQDKRMKVYLVFQVVLHEGEYLMHVFSSAEKAFYYKSRREELNEPEDVSYEVQEEEVK